MGCVCAASSGIRRLQVEVSRDACFTAREVAASRSAKSLNGSAQLTTVCACRDPPSDCIGSLGLIEWTFETPSLDGHVC